MASFYSTPTNLSLTLATVLVASIVLNEAKPTNIESKIVKTPQAHIFRSLVCLFVCGHKNEQFERNRAVYELYLLRMSQKSKNISFYIPHERERTSGSQEKQTFQFFSLY